MIQSLPVVARAGDGRDEVGPLAAGHARVRARRSARSRRCPFAPSQADRGPRPSAISPVAAGFGRDGRDRGEEGLELDDARRPRRRATRRPFPCRSCVLLSSMRSRYASCRRVPGRRERGYRRRSARASQPRSSLARAERGDEPGGVAGPRGRRSSRGMGLPVTRRAASRISRTERPVLGAEVDDEALVVLARSTRGPRRGRGRGRSRGRSRGRRCRPGVGSRRRRSGARAACPRPLP